MRLTKPSVSKQRRRCVEQVISLQGLGNTREPVDTVKEPERLASVPWVEQYKQRGQTTHSSTCHVTDRESNEVKDLREATELIEGWQLQSQGGQAMNGPSLGRSEAIF